MQYKIDLNYDNFEDENSKSERCTCNFEKVLAIFIKKKYNMNVIDEF